MRATHHNIDCTLALNPVLASLGPPEELNDPDSHSFWAHLQKEPLYCDINKHPKRLLRIFQGGLQ